MAYRNARDVLPEDVLQIVQRYAAGDCLYIPRDRHLRRPSDALKPRNEAIRQAYRQGQTVRELSRKYYLSTQAIYKILHRQT